MKYDTDVPTVMPATTLQARTNPSYIMNAILENSGHYFVFAHNSGLSACYRHESQIPMFPKGFQELLFKNEQGPKPISGEDDMTRYDHVCRVGW
jgi:hypothetical protein